MKKMRAVLIGMVFAAAQVAPAPVSAAMSILEMDEAAGKLVLEFEKDGRRIFYDMRLGHEMELPPTAEDLAANPDLPTYSVDAQVSDVNGDVFHSRAGGDGFVDTDSKKQHVENIDELGRVQDIQLMREAIPAFRRLKIPSGLEQLRLTGIQLGQGVEDKPKKPGYTTLSANALVKMSREGMLEGVNVAWGPSSVSKWDFLVRKQSILRGAGHHSAVHLRGWSSSGNVVYNAESCNHGTCATAMEVHCVMPGFKTDDGTHSRFFYSVDGGGHNGCNTGYSSISWRGHNCNDDSELQGRAISWDQDMSWWKGNGSCHNVAPHNWAPGCKY